jgi:glycine/D-amino acid oxidase-like deaminating enzyme
VTSAGGPRRNGAVSFWWADAGGLPALRPPLSGDTTADVCIVGAGYTGLWAAWYLKRAAPDLDILVLEREFAGYGASGRNGGWLTGGFGWAARRYLPAAGRAGVQGMMRALAGSVDEVIGVAEAAGIDADIRRCDELMVAVTPTQLVRAREAVAEHEGWQMPARLIGAEEARARVNLPGLMGAMVLPGMARVQPAKLVSGLARAVEAAGVRIVEGTAVRRIAPGRVETDRGTVRAATVLRCTEGYTADLPGHRRDWLPLNSAQVVTAPLPEALWREIGWQGHELLGDFANSYCYAQRTREGRIALGGRGVPYRFGSRTDTGGAVDAGTLGWLVERLHRHFPALRGHPIDHAWCGVLGVPRDWCATVGYDPGARIGFAGGYVGVGVATSNLAGRTLADLVLGRDTDLTRLPWVNHRVRRWEPEPLRWLGVNLGLRVMGSADGVEERTGRPARRAEILAPLSRPPTGPKPGEGPRPRASPGSRGGSWGGTDAATFGSVAPAGDQASRLRALSATASGVMPSSR